MKSILHDKREGTCFLCMRLSKDYHQKQVQEHHVFFGSSRRRLSEKYGLKVYLCLGHHLSGTDAVHRNAKISNELKEIAQIEFEKKHGEELFLSIFQKNYRT